MIKRAMIKRAMVTGLSAMSVFAAPVLAAVAPGSGPTRAHVAPAYPKCAPPTVPVWGKVSTLGAIGWHCMLPPAPNCGMTANAKWHPAQSKWTCVPCPPGEIAYTTKALGGGTLAHCKKPPHRH
jgi:hypothetical protein